MSDVNVNKLRKALGLSQQATADRATLTRSIISEVEGKKKGLSVAASLKAAPVLGIGPGSLYLSTQLAAVKAKLEESEISEEQASEKLLRVLRTVLERFEDIEGEEEADALISALEELLTETTGNAVQTARGAKPGAKTATKGRGAHPAILKAIDRVGTGATDPANYEVSDNRDLNGKALNSRNLRDPDEGRFPDPESEFGLANEPNEYYDDLPTDAYGDGRDLFGRRNRPMR